MTNKIKKHKPDTPEAFYLCNTCEPENSGRRPNDLFWEPRAGEWICRECWFAGDHPTTDPLGNSDPEGLSLETFLAREEPETNEFEQAFITFWGRFYGHEFQPSDPVDKEIRRAFRIAHKVGFESGHKAGAEAALKAERARVLREVKEICSKVIKSWDNVGDKVCSFYVEEVVAQIQKLKKAE